MTSNDPSPNVFWMLYDPERMTIDDAAIQVAEAQTLLGDHAPSRAALVLLHDPEAEIVDTADLVAELRTQFGDHDPPWDMFTKLYDSESMPFADAVARVVEARGRLDDDDPSWPVFIGIYDGSLSVADAVALAAKIESPDS